MRKKRILIIDDEEDFTSTLKVSLEGTGQYEVREENKGSRGLLTAKEFQPDLIILDIIMPDIKGGDVARQIKEDPSVKNIPIVFVTAILYESEEGIIGNYPFIAKPVTLEKLIQIIEGNLPNESN